MSNLVILQNGDILLTLEIGQGPAGPSTVAAQAAQAAAEFARDEAQAAAMGAAQSEANVNAQEMFAQDWASKLAAPVEGMEYSAKENAIGVTVPTGSSKQWSIKTGSVVADMEYSAKEYAQGETVPTGSAKQWATKLNDPVDGGLYSSRFYANSASVSSASAAISRDQAKGFATTVGAAASSVFTATKVYPTYAAMFAERLTFTYGQYFLVLKDETRLQKKVIYQWLQADPVAVFFDFTRNEYFTGAPQDFFNFIAFQNQIGRIQRFATFAAAQAAIESFENLDVIEVTSDETKNGRKTVYEFQSADPVSADYNFASGSYMAGVAVDTLVFLRYNDPQIVPAPVNGAAFGRLGEFAISGNTFLFHNGSTWLSVTGVPLP